MQYNIKQQLQVNKCMNSLTEHLKQKQWDASINTENKKWKEPLNAMYRGRQPFAAIYAGNSEKDGVGWIGIIT